MIINCSLNLNPWGYPLDGRSYQSDNTDYKFTGKQRDNETGYDYFGARYYDARIARWGGVELLLEKYLSYTPYQYGLLNPIKIADIDGKDGIVTIEGNKITVTVNFYYSTNELQTGYFEENTQAMRTLNKYITDAQNLWQNAANEYNNQEGNEYEVNFDIKLTKVDELPGNQNIPEGENVAKYNPEFGIEPSVNNGNRLYIAPLWNSKSSNDAELPGSQRLVTRPYTGPHEVGHAIGLSHIGKANSKKQLTSTNVMGYSKDRQPPNANDVKKFLNSVDKHKKEQKIRGDLSRY